MDLLKLLGLGGVIALLIWLFNRVFDRVDRQDKAAMKAAEEATAARVKAEWEQRATDRREFRKRARRLRAKITSVYESGRVNLMPNLHLSLSVQDPEGAFDVDVEHHVETMEVHRFREGKTVDVLVDPDDRQHVEID